MLKQTIEKEKIIKCNIISRDPMSVVPNDIKHFSNMYVDDDWNEAVYGQFEDLIAPRRSFSSSSSTPCLL